MSVITYLGTLVCVCVCIALQKMTTTTSSSTTLSQSILSMIPFTRAHRRATRQLRTLKLELEDDVVNAEVQRVGTIQHLMDDGRHDDALRQLLRDTESDLHYFNRLRYQKQKRQQMLPAEEAVVAPAVAAAATDTVDDDDDGDNIDKPCQWLGVDPNTGHKYRCINACAKHPWKTYRNVHGDEESVWMDFCPYHVRYCLDPNRRHVYNAGAGEDLVEVQCPNGQGLCNGCYVQIHRHRPPVPGSGVRMPGLRRFVRDDEKQVNEFVDVELHRISQAALYICCIWRGFIARQTARKMRSALRIQKAWRQFLTKTQLLRHIEYQQLIRDASRTGAATTIQRWVHKRLRGVQWRRYIQVSNQAIERVSANIDSDGGGCFDTNAEDQNAIGICDGNVLSMFTNDRREVETALSSTYDDTRDDLIDESTEIRLIDMTNRKDSEAICSPHEETFQDTDSHTIDSEIKEIERHISTSEDEIVDRIQCTVTCENYCVDDTAESCETEKNNSSRSLPKAQHLKIDKSNFLKYDTEKRGTVSRQNFRRALMEIWEANGAILLQPEFESIVDLCDKYRSGLVDYQSFIRFARLQPIPCRVHSRLVCAQCTVHGGSIHMKNSAAACKGFEPSPQSANICECGRYKGSHVLLPKPTLKFPAERGILSNKELETIFKLNRRADLELPFDVSARSEQLQPGLGNM